MSDIENKCNCLDELENPENYESKKGEIQSVTVKEASLLLNRKDGKTRREILLHLEVRYKGKPKADKQNLLIDFCPFCGIKLRSDDIEGEDHGPTNQ
jgi:hypothetical protein